MKRVYIIFFAYFFLQVSHLFARQSVSREVAFKTNVQEKSNTVSDDTVLITNAKSFSKGASDEIRNTVQQPIKLDALPKTGDMKRVPKVAQAKSSNKKLQPSIRLQSPRRRSLEKRTSLQRRSQQPGPPLPFQTNTIFHPSKIKQRNIGIRSMNLKPYSPDEGKLRDKATLQKTYTIEK